MKILLIGATGKVGGAVPAEATSRGHSVLAAARLDANDAAAIAVHRRLLTAMRR